MSDYTPDNTHGAIGIRFVSHDDSINNNHLTPDKKGNYIIDYEKLIIDDINFVRFFEKKYNIKLCTVTQNDPYSYSYYYEYFHIFKCEVGKEDELIKIIDKDVVVNHCSRIDERIIYIPARVTDAEDSAKLYHNDRIQITNSRANRQSGTLFRSLFVGDLKGDFPLTGNPNLISQINRIKRRLEDI